MIGQLMGHFRILSKIGEGGMGVVYRAHDEVLHRDIALKVVVEQAALEASSKEFLLHEARSASAVNHPNICTIYEVGEFNGEPFIAMELIEGKPLSALLRAGGMPVESVIRYGVQIAAALNHAHSRNVVHRDLKSSNIVVTPDGHVKILDFGLARRLPGESFHEAETISPSEKASVVAGTLTYMPPEVLRGKPGDAQSDLWSLGVVLYEAAAGQLPFLGRTSFEVSSAILNDLPAPLPSRIPTMLRAIIQRCLAKEPSQRYQSAGEALAALEAVQSSSVIVAQPGGDARGLTTTVLRGIRHLIVKNGDVLMLVGTTKGAFFLRSNQSRSHWDVAGPYFHGQAVYSMAFDDRAGRHRIWASTQSPIWGAFLRSTDDFGKSWTSPQEAQIKFPPESGASLNQIWQIVLGRADEPDMLYCGVDPAALFVSRDNGETWSLVRELYEHPDRRRWNPGFGGLTLHTILLDPTNKQRMYAAISAGGVYLTEDGGATWTARNRGVRVVFQPERYPPCGQCVHKIVMHPSRPDRLFLQNHWGLYRSNDAGESWLDIANGVPSDFGFAMVMHPRDPDCVYILPLESDEFRCTPEGRVRVYRTRNAGASWEALTRGLPQKRSYETVVRDGMTSDFLDPLGLYFGTRGGMLYGSIDEGRTWKKILDGLPPIVSLRVASIGQPKSSPRGTSDRKPKKVPSRTNGRVAGKTPRASNVKTSKATTRAAGSQKTVSNKSRTSTVKGGKAKSSKAKSSKAKSSKAKSSKAKPSAVTGGRAKSGKVKSSKIK